MTPFGRPRGHLCERKWARVKYCSRAKIIIIISKGFGSKSRKMGWISKHYSTNVDIQKCNRYCASHSRGIEGIFEVQILYIPCKAVIRNQDCRVPRRFTPDNCVREIVDSCTARSKLLNLPKITDIVKRHSEVCDQCMRLSYIRNKSQFRNGRTVFFSKCEIHSLST
jgi:hypothetical protein